MKPYLKLHQNVNRTVVVGDIHGCYGELIELLKSIDFSDSDLLISVGDFVDRGPKSAALIDYFMNTSNAYSVKGNHERRLVGVAKRKSKAAWTQLHTLHKLRNKKGNEWITFLDNLPVVIENQHAIVVHARLDPSKGIKDQDEYFATAVGGPSVKIDTDNLGVPLWFYEWSKRNIVDKPICFGHLEYKNDELIENQLYALDTGAVQGIKLSALVLPEYKIVSIDVKQNYFKKSKSEWSEIEFLSSSVDSILISKVLDLEKQDSIDKFQKKAVEEFYLQIDRMNFQLRIENIKSLIHKKFGKLPGAGVERGNYFKSIREKFPNVNSRLLNLILSNKDYDILKYLQLFRNGTLLKFDEETKLVEKYLLNEKYNKSDI